MQKISLESIRLDGETQARVALDSGQVTEYASALKEGAQFPPIVVFHDGSHNWLADGFHRYHAYKSVDLTEIEAEVKTGSVQEAQLYAFGANARRGLSCSRDDIHSIVLRMLKHPISQSWTNAEVARHVGISGMTVGRIKASMGPDTQPKAYKRNGKDIQVDTEKLKSKKPAEKQEEKPEVPEVVKPAEPQENDDQVQELIDTINELTAENMRLKDIVAVGQWDASDIEKLDVQDTLNDLRDQVRNLEIDNKALRDSRDMFQNRNADLMKTVKSLQAKIKKLES